MRILSIVCTNDDRDVPVTGVHTIDHSHTSVDFVGAHLTVTGVRGRFPDVSGSITGNDDHVAFSAAAEAAGQDWRLTRNLALQTGGLLLEKARIELNVQAVAAT